MAVWLKLVETWDIRMFTGRGELELRRNWPWTRLTRVACCIVIFNHVLSWPTTCSWINLPLDLLRSSYLHVQPMASSVQSVCAVKRDDELEKSEIKATKRKIENSKKSIHAHKLNWITLLCSLSIFCSRCVSSFNCFLRVISREFTCVDIIRFRRTHWKEISILGKLPKRVKQRRKREESESR